MSSNILTHPLCLTQRIEEYYGNIGYLWIPPQQRKRGQNFGHEWVRGCRSRFRKLSEEIRISCDQARCSSQARADNLWEGWASISIHINTYHCIHISDQTCCGQWKKDDQAQTFSILIYILMCLAHAACPFRLRLGGTGIRALASLQHILCILIGGFTLFWFSIWDVCKFD